MKIAALFLFLLHLAPPQQSNADAANATDTWRLTIDDVNNGKTERFGDTTLERMK